MPKYQALEVTMSSGDAGTQEQLLKRVQNASWNYSVPRFSAATLGRFKIMSDRPVINFTPVLFQLEMLKSDNVAETNFGLTHPSGVAIILGTGGDGNRLTNYTARNLTYIISDPAKLTYDNEFRIKTGVLTSYAVNASVGVS